MKKGLNIIFMFLFAIAFIGADTGAGFSAAADGKSSVQKICPVLGGEINKNIFTDYKGSRIYFCCPACIDDFKKDPEKYIKKIKDSGVVPEKTPAR